MPTRLTHGLGVRTDSPTSPPSPREVSPRTPKASTSAMAATFEAASSKSKLKAVSTAQAKALETRFNGASAKTENLSAGRVGASIQGMVVNGELFVRTKAVRPGAAPAWASAGPLKEAPKPKPKPETTSPGGWAPKPGSLEARVQKLVGERMGMMSHPDFALKGSEATEMKKAIANGDFQVVNASPKGLAGVALTGYVQDNILIVEKKAVAPGAKSTFFYLGAIN